MNSKNTEKCKFYIDDGAGRLFSECAFVKSILFVYEFLLRYKAIYKAYSPHIVLLCFLAKTESCVFCLCEVLV